MPPLPKTLRSVALLAYLLAAPIAHAKSHKWRLRVDLFAEGGGSFFDPGELAPEHSTALIQGTSTPEVVTTTQALQDSWRLFAGEDLWFTRHDAIQFSYAYSPADVSFAQTFSPPPPPGSGLFSFTGTAIERLNIFSLDYVRSFNVGRRWRLLLAAGVGRPLITSQNSNVELGNSASIAFNLGVGLQYNLARHWALRTDYRDFILRERFPSTGLAFEEDHSPTIGIVFRF